MEKSPLKPTSKGSPELTETVLITAEAFFSSATNLAEMTDIEVARHHIISTHNIIFAQLSKLSKLQELLRSDLGVEKEEEGLQVTRKLADQVMDTAFKLESGAGKLVDDIDCLIGRLRGKKERIEEGDVKEETDMM